MTEDEMVGWHHQLNGREFEQAPGVGDGQGSLVRCSPWGHKELDTTERLSLFTLNIMLKSDHPFKIIVLKNFGVHTPVFSFF